MYSDYGTLRSAEFDDLPTRMPTWRIALFVLCLPLLLVLGFVGLILVLFVLLRRAVCRVLIVKFQQELPETEVSVL